MALATVTSGMAGEAGAQSAETTVQTVVIENPIETAKRFIAEDRLEEARFILRATKQAADRAALPIYLQEIDFLLGVIAFDTAEYQAAIARFREMLEKNPGLSRVRLELARSYFMTKDDGKAAFHFEFVLAGDVPANVRANIERFLLLIKRRKKWQINFNFSLVPDSNVNVAPDDNRVTLFGLPFELSDEARETSGLGWVVGAGGEYLIPLSKVVKMRTGARVRHTDYSGGSFDDTIITALVGPQFTFESISVDVLLTGYKRWFGQRAFTRAIGPRVDVQKRISPRLRLDSSVFWQYVDYATDDSRDGPLISFTTQATYWLNTRSYGQVFAGILRESTDAKVLRNTSWRMGLGYFRELGRGTSLYLRPELTLRPFDAVQAAFGEKRKDVRLTLDLNITKTNWSILGFAPVFSYGFSTNHSNIDFFEYTRHRGQIGFTRTF